MPKDILVTEQYRGTWDNQPDGPAAWRRSVYVYQRRSLPYPMFETFDHPDMNVTAGARNVSTVPTQALTLLNNPFVLRRPNCSPNGSRARRRDPVASRSISAYRIALARPPTRQENRSIALETGRKAGRSVDFTHVLLNLDEFLYMR